MNCIFLFDTFQRGGLELSCAHLFGEISKLSIPSTIWTLSNSKDFLERSIKSFPRNTAITYFPNRFILYYSYAKLSKSFLCISFKNHLPYIIIKFLFRVNAVLVIRHSNTILYDIIRPNYRREDRSKTKLDPLGLFSKFFSYIKLFCLTSCYSINEFHVCNCLENKMLLQIFLNRHAFCYINKDILAKEFLSPSYGPLLGRIELLWASRYCPSKDVSTLVDALSCLHSSLPDHPFCFHAYTTKPELLSSSLASAGLPPDSFSIYSWTEYKKKPCDIYIHTAYHEGLSNAFMEQLFHSRNVVCPLTSSGFLEFSSLIPCVSLYRPGDYVDLTSALRTAIFSLYESVDPQDLPSFDKYHTCNQQFLGFVHSFFQ